MAVHGFTLYDMIGRGASLYGDAPAILQGDRAWSFREFHRRVELRLDEAGVEVDLAFALTKALPRRRAIVWDR